MSNKNHIFDTEAARTSPSLNEIYTRGLAIIDTKQSTKSFTRDIAVKYDAPYGRVDMWLDHDLTPAALNRQIRLMMDVARAKKQVIVMLNNYPASLKSLQKFLESNAAQEFQLAPLSAQVKYE